jgi:hypothetical protein
VVWLLSTAAVATQRQSHTMNARIDILHGGRRVRSLSPEEGSVTADSTRPTLRNLLCTVSDPTGELSGGDLGDLMSPYDSELAVYRGIVLYEGTPRETTEWAPLGVFQITGRGIPGSGAITVEAQDRAIMYQGGMTGSLGIDGNTPVEKAIARLLSTRNSGVTLLPWRTGFTCGPLLYAPDIDVWNEALLLAQSAGGTLYHDRLGRLVFAPSVPTSGRPVRRFADGDRLLLGAERKEDSDSVHNVVVVESEKTGNGGVIHAEAADTDPRSPTYYRGRYGRRVGKPIKNPHVSSQNQADQMAATELIRELGRSETATVTVACDLGLDPNDVTTIHRPSSGLDNRGLVIESMTTPLTAEESMQLKMRSSIIAQNGHILDVTPLAA